MSTAATGAARPAPVPGARPRSLKDMLAVNFGNALEWNDWNVYTCLLYTSPSPRD